MFEEVADTLNELGVDLKNCWGQRYDGAGAVSAVVNGVSALTLKENEKALSLYRLNLAMNTSCKITSFRIFMNIIKEITYFLNFSPICSEHLQGIIKNGSQNKCRTKRFDVCHTRLVSRIGGEYFCLSPDSNVNMCLIVV